MCCKEQLPCLLFIVQKNKVWSYISVEDLGHIVCDGLYVLGLYVFIYMYAIYIPQTDLLDMGRKVLKLLLENGPLCHVMALERTLSRC